MQRSNSYIVNWHHSSQLYDIDYIDCALLVQSSASRYENIENIAGVRRQESEVKPSLHIISNFLAVPNLLIIRCNYNDQNLEILVRFTRTNSRNNIVRSV